MQMDLYKCCNAVIRGHWVNQFTSSPQMIEGRYCTGRNDD